MKEKKRGKADRLYRMIQETVRVDYIESSGVYWTIW